MALMIDDCGLMNSRSLNLNRQEVTGCKSGFDPKQPFDLTLGPFLLPLENAHWRDVEKLRCSLP